MESRALATPRESVINKDITDYTHLIRAEVIRVLRTPLRLGRPDSLQATSAVVLHFTYDPHSEELSRRFILEDGTVTPSQELLQEVTSATERQITEHHYNCPSLPPEHFQVYLVFKVKYRLDPRHRPQEGKHLAKHAPFIASLDSWSGYIPLHKRKLLPDWLSYLKKALSKDLPRLKQWVFLDEIRESEGCLVARKAEAWLKARPRKI
ncbi:hypothetical protein P7C70_g5168, partial [Phenoliferia sp. Uapishka_3]